MIFLSTFENKIDSKGRISVPAPFRAALEANPQPLIITRSLTDECLQGQGAQRINQIVDILDTMDSLSPEVQVLQTLLADAHEMKMDAEGRISLPESMIAMPISTPRFYSLALAACLKSGTPKPIATVPKNSAIRPRPTACRN